MEFFGKPCENHNIFQKESSESFDSLNASIRDNMVLRFLLRMTHETTKKRKTEELFNNAIRRQCLLCLLLLFSNVPNLIWSDVRKLLIFVSPERIDVRTDKARFPELYLFHLDLVLVLVLIASR